MVTRAFIVAVVAALYLLHQDVWFWRSARPLVFGFVPVGLAYHAGFCLAAAELMWMLTRLVWPSHLDIDAIARSGAGHGAPASDELGGVQGSPPFKQ